MSYDLPRRLRQDIEQRLVAALDRIRAHDDRRLLLAVRREERQVLLDDPDALRVVRDLDVADADFSACTLEPPSSCSAMSCPVTALTSGGPPSAIDPMSFTIGTKSASPGI